MTALDMSEVKVKLEQLDRHMPHPQPEFVLEFGKLLAGYLNPRLVPQGFVMACHLAVSDCARGEHGLGGKIPGKLAGMPPMVYVGLLLTCEQIAEAVLPAEFADEVQRCFTGVRERAKG